MEDKFWSSIVVVENCWHWLRHRTPRGYGTFRVNGRLLMAHRWAYEHFKGPIPDGLTLDHLCRNRGCVNPDHLEPVTLRENILRGTSPSAADAKKTHCIHGHEFFVQNTWITSQGKRVCRTCRAAIVRKRRRKLRGSSAVLGRCPDDASPNGGLPGPLGAAL